MDLCLKHKEKVAGELEKLEKAGHDIYADEEFDEEHLADPAMRLEMAEGLIYSMCQSKSMDTMTDMMECCGIPYRWGELSDETQCYQYVYYRTDGQPIKSKIEERFVTCHRDISNWLAGNTFDVEIPGENFCSNVTDSFTSHEAKHPLADLIKAQIDGLRAVKKGKYKIIASRANYDAGTGRINYVKNDNIELFASDLTTAKRMVEFYNGQALLQENESPGNLR